MRLGRDERGASALEFALVAPVLVFVILGLMQLSLALYAQHVLEESLSAGARHLYFDMTDEDGALDAARQMAAGYRLDPRMLQVSTTRHTTPYPYVELDGTYRFTGLGVGLPNGSVNLHATTEVTAEE